MIRIVNVKVNQLVRSMFTMLSVRYIFVRQCWLYFFRCNANGSPFTLICDVLIGVKLQPFYQMQDMYREQLWQKQSCPRELYPDASSKDAPVPPDLPVPNCDCGHPADVFQLRHLDTAARCFYTCSHFNISNSFVIFFFFICFTRLLIFCWNLVVQAHER